MGLARQLPHQPEAELSVLTTILSDHSGQAIEQALLLLEPEHFYYDSHRLVFSVCQTLYAQGVIPEPLSVIRELDREHRLASLGRIELRSFTPLSPEEKQAERERTAREWVTDLGRDLPVLRLLPQRARLVKEAWGKRLVIEHFTKPMQGAWNGAGPQEILRQVENACQALHSLVVDEGDSQVVSALDAATAAQKRVQEGVSVEGAVPPPYRFLDDLMPGRLYLLGGYAKDGKTDVGAQAAAVACNARIPTGFVSIEMPQAYLMDRLIAQFGVPYGPLQKGVVTDTYLEAWKRAIGTIGTWPLTIYDDPACDVADIIRFQRLGRFKFLVIDHLHQISYEDARDARLRLSANVKALAKLARLEQIPILLLAQLHRSTGYGDGFPRPTMQSFKETGTIEQVASALWAVYRKRDKESGERTAETEFLVMADRFGEDGLHRMQFDGQFQRFTETDWRHA